MTTIDKTVIDKGRSNHSKELLLVLVLVLVLAVRVSLSCEKEVRETGQIRFFPQTSFYT